MQPTKTPWRRTRLRASGMLAIAALAGATMIALARPAAAEQSCTGAPNANVCLDITYAGAGNYNVHVGIDAHIPILDALNIVAYDPQPFSVYMMSHDSDGDWDLFQFPEPTDIGTWVDENGFGNLSADFDILVPYQLLNEDDDFYGDDGFFDYDDELFAIVALGDTPRQRTFRYYSNIVIGQY